MCELASILYYVKCGPSFWTGCTQYIIQLCPTMYSSVYCESVWCHCNRMPHFFYNFLLSMFVVCVLCCYCSSVKKQTSEKQRICINFCFKQLLKLTKHFKQHFMLRLCIEHKPLNDIQGVPGGMCQTSGECSLGQTILI